MRHGDERRIVNSGEEQWKRLCSNMASALDDDDDEPLVVSVLIRTNSVKVS